MLPTAVIHPPKISAVAIMSASLFFLVTGYAAAGDMMSTICSNNVVSVGDMKGEVLAKCGKPLSRFAGGTEERVSTSTHPAGKGRKAPVKREKGAETWTYNMDGSYRFFIFRGGRLEKIQTGGLVN